MVFLRTVAVILLAASPGLAFASGEDYEPDYHQIAVDEQAKSLCHSTKEYIETLQWLRASRDFVLPEHTSRLIAKKVSRGCDGAAARFSQVLLTLKGVGVSDPGALAMALDFSSQSPDVQKNFTEIFTRAYLNEFFGYEYPQAVRIAIELSKDYKGEPAQVREDFIELVRYCKDGKTLDLPNNLCAEYVMKLAHLSQYFPDGVRGPFYKLFNQLRNDRKYHLDMKTAMEVSYNVLRNGPMGPENFYSGFDFATKKDGLNMSLKPALAFAIQMADRSFVGNEGDEHPPAIRPAKDVELGLQNEKVQTQAAAP